MITLQCKHSLKRNRQDDYQYVHDEVLYISSWLHQISRAVMHGRNDGPFWAGTVLCSSHMSILLSLVLDILNMPRPPPPMNIP